MPQPCVRRAGSASRNVLLLVLVAGVILVALAVFLRSGPPASSGAIAPGAADRPAPASEVALSASPEAPRSSLDNAGVKPSGDALGVRLAGEGRLEGRVIDRASGAGVAGVRVDLTPLPPAATTLVERILRLVNFGPEIPERVRPVAAVLTEEGGTFAFAGVRAGSWFLEARGPFHAPESAVRARVAPSGSGGPLDVHVRRGGRVVGRVIAPDGKPASSARVFLMGGPGRFLEDVASGDLRLFESECDAQGAFAFDGVPAGAGYDLSASDDRFAVSHLLDVVVVAGQETSLELEARAGGTIVGRVLGTRGTDLPEPIAGAHVAVVPRGLRDLLLVGEILAATHCVTGADGTFTMRHVPPGEVDLAAVAPGHLPGLGGRASVADLATVTADDVLLAPGTMIRGRTVDPAGQPIAGVLVRWQPLSGMGGGDELNFAQYLTQAIPGFVFPTTDADGRFEAGPMSGSPPYSLDFIKVGWKEAHQQVDEEQAKTEVTVVLHRGGSVEGVVVDAGNSEPVKSFTVSTSGVIDTQAGVPGRWNPFTGGQLFEDEAGRFRLESVEAGKAHLIVDSPGYAEGEIEIDVVEGETTRDVRIELHPGGVVRGIVVDEEEHPVAGAHVVAVSENPDSASEGGRRGPGAMMRDIDSVPSALMGYAAGLGLLAHREAVSDAGGRFELEGVETGDLHLRAFHREHAWGISPKLTMTAGGTVEGVRVEMHLGGGVEGTVTDRYGRPVASDVVVALAPMALGGMGGNNKSMGALYQGFTDAKGAYKISHMAAGSYFLVVTRGDEALNPMSFLGRLNFDMVTVPEGQVVKYDLVDTTSGGCRVTGMVLDSGRPVAEGMLQAMGFEGGGALGIDMKMARLSGDGHFEFPGLAPGKWQLTLQDIEGPDVRMQLEVPDQPEYRVDLSLPEGGLEGTVIDAATNEPVAEANVTVRPVGAPKVKGLLSLAMGGETGTSRSQTSDQGLFRFSRLCEAEYEVSVRPPNNRDSGKKWAPPEPITVRVREGRIERGCVLRLSPPLTLTGSVRGSSGEPLDGARVLLRRQDRAESRPERARSDANGRFEIGGLAPGIYLASATAKDHAGSTVRDIQVEGKDAQVEIRLQPGVVVTVRVFGSDGQPLTGARATLLRSDSDTPMEAADADRMLEGLFKGEGASDIEGRIEMGRFLPGEYRLEVTRGASTATRPKVRIDSDRDEVELRADLP